MSTGLELNMSKSIPMRAARYRRTLGCLVVLEPGAKWPQRTFATIPYRDGVVILRNWLGEPIEAFLRRLHRQCAMLTDSGVKFMAAIVACSGSGKQQTRQRLKLKRDILEHVLTGGEGQLFFA